jgi:hypothetical protein
VPLTPQQIEQLKRCSGMMGPQRSVPKGASDETRNHSQRQP